MATLKIALASTLLAMGLAAGNANAALSFSTDISNSSSFSNSTSFSINNTSKVSAVSTLIGSPLFDDSYLKDVTVSLVALSNNAVLATKTVSFANGATTFFSQIDFSKLLLTKGNYSLNFSGDSYTPFNGTLTQNIYVAAVPEPESIAMMGLGLGALLLRLKRKKAGNAAMMPA
ncbi:FxDxF family PEP-CTERM protein [Aquitalea sp. LB_tupeE]|uniref:FxDxF family PEP-CTERM protein n=1 Tax=Aquitalea sp. LB_tupeE TaxID=2748078 RepID=UPI0015BEAEF6|nr:FxDxF family PEP-CTERM protein [Aquitalea sp. LB_tupeE]NWK79442.1 FxDxF family PEP-CTERM protein [Aquitalea sp. LB_tupeE]